MCNQDLSTPAGWKRRAQNTGTHLRVEGFPLERGCLTNALDLAVNGSVPSRHVCCCFSSVSEAGVRLRLPDLPCLSSTPSYPADDPEKRGALWLLLRLVGERGFGRGYRASKSEWHGVNYRIVGTLNGCSHSSTACRSRSVDRRHGKQHDSSVVLLFFA